MPQLHALRFVLFTLLALGVPALAIALLPPGTADQPSLGMVVLIVMPMVAGFAVTRGLPRPERQGRAWLALGLAALLVLGIMAVTTPIGWLAGIVSWTGAPVAVGGAVAGLISALITSTLEELGWAAGGLRTARRGLGRTGGVIALGLVWGTWHLIPAALAPQDPITSGIFPLGSPFTPGVLVGFFAGVLAYRVLLTELQDLAGGRVWPAVVAHVAGNVWFGVLVGSGLLAFSAEGPWWAYPSIIGLPFVVLSALAALGVHRLRTRAQDD